MSTIAYWASLKGAESSVNSSSVTIYLPVKNKLSPETFYALMKRILQKDILTYTQPNKDNRT
jgi:predicted transcriptional regulator